MALHAASLAAQWISAPRLDVGMSVSLYVLAAACVGWPLTRGQREARTLLAALAGLAAAGPVLFYAERPPPSPVLLAHLLPGILAYAFALVALAQFIGLRAAENRLKSGKMEADAPPILELEASCFRSVAAAFGLLTLTLMTGAFQAALTPDFRLWTHKNIFAGLTWLAFCALLIGRRTHGWRGKSARTWAAAAFALLALSYFGSHFVSKSSWSDNRAGRGLNLQPCAGRGLNPRPERSTHAKAGEQRTENRNQLKDSFRGMPFRIRNCGKIFSGGGAFRSGVQPPTGSGRIPKQSLGTTGKSGRVSAPRFSPE